MANTELTIALAQLNPVVGDVSGNMRRVQDTWKEQDSTAGLIVFSEMFLCGYPAEDLLLRSHFITDLLTATSALIEQSKHQESWIILPAPWQEEERLYNAALVIGEGKIQHISYKNNLPNEGVFDEKRYFIPGSLPSPFDYKGYKLGIMICQDMWSAECARHLKDQGADILLVPNGSPYDTDKQFQRLKKAEKRCRETGLPLLYCNQVGGQDELVFDGASFAMDAKTNVIGQAKHCAEDILHVTFEDSEIRCKTNGPLPEQSQAIYDACVLALRDYVTKNHFPGVLIGLSGGIDSALVAAMAVDALGTNKVHCVMMPSPFTSKESLEDAKALANNLGCHYEIINITDGLTAFEKTLPGLEGTAHENIQSRLRGNILMALSNQKGFMVVSTGNKSEMSVGYATLYGDMCGGFNPLKDLYKMQVYALAALRNKTNTVIPENILTKAPSAELRDNQTDQDSLPPYDVLDDILCALIEQALSPEEIVAKREHDADIVQHVAKLLQRAEYKRRQACPGVKITPLSFGKERRYPITNAS